MKGTTSSSEAGFGARQPRSALAEKGQSVAAPEDGGRCRPEDFARATWNLQPAQVESNLAPNPDLTLRWLTPDAPDHWRLDAARHQWVSDTIPVIPGRSYRAGCELSRQAAENVELQWMSHAWEIMKIPTVPFDFSKSPRAEVSLTVPTGAIFVRFIVKARHDPGSALKEIFIQAEHL